jgi:DNA-binding beta-propeller fold protein YncE
LGFVDGQFVHPTGLDSDAQGFIYVADSGNNRVQKFTPDGRFVLKFGGPEFPYLNLSQLGRGPGEFQGPASVAVGPEGDVYVTDFLGMRVKRFGSDGSYRSQWGGLGSTPGKFILPDFIDTDDAGNVYVTDLGNDRIQKFTRTGEFVLQWGGFGSGPGQFATPHVIEVDGHDVYGREGSKTLDHVLPLGSFRPARLRFDW